MKYVLFRFLAQVFSPDADAIQSVRLPINMALSHQHLGKVTPHLSLYHALLCISGELLIMGVWLTRPRLDAGKGHDEYGVLVMGSTPSSFWS